MSEIEGLDWIAVESLGVCCMMIGVQQGVQGSTSWERGVSGVGPKADNDMLYGVMSRAGSYALSFKMSAYNVVTSAPLTLALR